MTFVKRRCVYNNKSNNRTRPYVTKTTLFSPQLHAELKGSLIHTGNLESFLITCRKQVFTLVKLWTI